MPVELVHSGQRGSVCKFVRSHGRCPFDKFHKGMERAMRKKFDGSFRALGQQGPDYENQERFRPLSGEGRPLWEFKEHDHRLYCIRKVVGTKATVILLNGWVKDKEGKTREEAREIQRAKSLYDEYEREPGRQS